MQAELFVVLDFSLGCVEDNEVRLEVCFLFRGRFDEHVADEMCLPSNFNDEADSHARVLVCTAEAIDDEEALVGELFLGDILYSSPSFLGCLVVIVVISLRIPPNRVVRRLVVNDEFIFRRTAREDARLDINSAEFGNLALLVARQAFLRLFLEQRLVGRIVDDFRRTRDTILTKIDVCHLHSTSFIIFGPGKPLRHLTRRSLTIAMQWSASSMICCSLSGELLITGIILTYSSINVKYLFALFLTFYLFFLFPFTSIKIRETTRKIRVVSLMVFVIFSKNLRWQRP